MKRGLALSLGLVKAGGNFAKKVKENPLLAIPAANIVFKLATKTDLQNAVVDPNAVNHAVRHLVQESEEVDGPTAVMETASIVASVLGKR